MAAVPGTKTVLLAVGASVLRLRNGSYTTKKVNKTCEDAVKCIDLRFTEVHHEGRGCPLGIPRADDVKSFGNAAAVFILRHECGHDDVVHIGADAEEEQRQCVPCRFVRGVEETDGPVATQQTALPRRLMDEQQTWLPATVHFDVPIGVCEAHEVGCGLRIHVRAEDNTDIWVCQLPLVNLET